MVLNRTNMITIGIFNWKFGEIAENHRTLKGSLQNDNRLLIRPINLHLKWTQITAELSLTTLWFFLGLEISFLVLTSHAIGTCKIHLIAITSFKTGNRFKRFSLLFYIQTSNYAMTQQLDPLPLSNTLRCVSTGEDATGGGGWGM